MEDLEFRVWDKRISEWQNHLLKVNEDGCLFFSHPYVAPECYEIMQYISHKDNDGKKIFTGDIVEDNVGRTWIVSYKPSVFVFLWVKDKTRFQPYSRFISVQKPLKIIGNKFQNPELLEEK